MWDMWDICEIYTLSFVYQEDIQYNYNIFLSIHILNDDLYEFR